MGKDPVAVREELQTLHGSDLCLGPGQHPAACSTSAPCFPAVTRIVRVISQPRGNMLLIGIGGSGRQSLARLASSICEYYIFQIEVSRQYRKQEFREGEGVPLSRASNPTGLSLLYLRSASACCIFFLQISRDSTARQV